MASLPDGVIFTMKSKDKGTAVEFNYLKYFVFCKNCKYATAQDNECVWCGHVDDGLAHDPDWFCADGERRTD